MADTRESIILGVELDAGKVADELANVSRQIANVKKEQKQLDDEYKSGKISLAEYTQSTAAMKDELSWLQKQQKGNIATQKLLTATTDTYSDSLNGQRQKLADMQKAYDQLDATARESEGGREFLKQIQAQTNAVKGLEEQTGRAQRNVGNYPKVLQMVIAPMQTLTDLGEKLKGAASGMAQAATGAGGAFQAFTGGLKAATIQALKFIATPIGAILTAIAAVLGLVVKAFSKLTEAFKKNDNAGTSWAKLMATFQPLINAVGKAFDYLASAIGKVAEKLANWIGSKNKAVKAAQDLIQATDDLQEAERQYVEQSAKRNMEISELRSKAAEKDKYTAQERLKFLSDAIEKEKQNLEEQKAIKAEELRILEETAKANSDTSDATKDKIAAARAAMYQAEQAYYDGTRKLQKEFLSTRKEIQGELDAIEAEQLKKAEKNAEALANVREQMRLREMSELERQIDALQKARDEELAIEGLSLEERAKIQTYYLDEIAKKHEEFAAKLKEENEKLNAEIGLRDLEAEEEDVPTVEETVRKMFGLDAEGVEYFKQLMADGYDFATAKMAAITDQQQRMALSYANSLGQMGDAMGQLGSAIGDLAGKNKAAVAASKAMTLVSILMNQAKAISEGAVAIAKGIASASALPYPANIPAIISTVAQITGLMAGVLTSIAQAKKVFAQGNSQKFARGGIVEGNAYAGDNVTVQADAGEMYLNRQTQHDLFNFLTGKENSIQAGYNLEAMTTAMTAAVAAMPAPVMVYEEFRTFEGNVASFNEIAKIG